jgi:hypothetical protein
MHMHTILLHPAENTELTKKTTDWVGYGSDVWRAGGES